MKLLEDNAVNVLADNFLSFFNIQDYKDIIQFVEQDVDLSNDISANYDKINLDMFPYMVQPLCNATIEKDKRKQIVVVWGDQMGKTTLEYLSILYNCCYNSLQAIILYPSLELAVEMNQIKFLPLFKNIPQFAQDLKNPFAIRGDRLKLSNAVIWFDGAGKKIVGKSSKLVLGDECSLWGTPNNINNIEQLKKRTRTYNECLQIFCSTPRYQEDAFWGQFLQSSQGYYTLCCKGCGQLSMRSCDIHNLQFESEYNEELKLYQVVQGSCRLICPKCNHEHTDEDRQFMVKNGGYVHRYPNNTNIYGYQAGVLASLLNVHSFDAIATAQLNAGRGASLEQYLSLDNSIKALPLQPHNSNKQQQTSLQQHFYQNIDKDKIEAIVVSSDTQDTFSVYAVTALTTDNNYYVLECGRCRYLFLDDEERKIINAENKRNNKQPQITLLDILNRQYYGIKPLCLLIDSGGHRTDEVNNFAKMQKNILLYKGTSLKFETWKISQNYNKLFLVDFKKSLSQFIFMLHFNKNKNANYLYLPKNITEKDMQQILSFKPDNTKRNGNLFENWTPEDRVHDMADTIRYSIICFKIASKIYRKQRFLHGEAKILNIQKQPIKHRPSLSKHR